MATDIEAINPDLGCCDWCFRADDRFGPADHLIHRARVSHDVMIDIADASGVECCLGLGAVATILLAVDMRAVDREML